MEKGIQSEFESLKHDIKNIVSGQIVIVIIIVFLALCFTFLHCYTGTNVEKVMKQNQQIIEILSNQEHLDEK